MQNNAKKTKLPNKTAKNSCFPAATSPKTQSPMALANIGDCFIQLAFIRIALSGLLLSGWLYPDCFIRIALSGLLYPDCFIRLAERLTAQWRIRCRAAALPAGRSR